MEQLTTKLNEQQKLITKLEDDILKVCTYLMLIVQLFLQKVTEIQFAFFLLLSVAYFGVKLLKENQHEVKHFMSLII